MIPNRPILYLTLPSIALIIGYIWLRRKKSVGCDTGGSSGKKVLSDNQLLIGLSDNKQEVAVNSRDQLSTSSSLLYSSNNNNHSESLPIGCGPQAKKQLETEAGDNQQHLSNSQSPPSAGTSSQSSSLGKSAPIDIAPNPRSPPKRVTEQDIDCEILKLKPQESDIKTLRYIEEPDDSDFEADSPTPADSPLYRNRFDLNPRQPKVEPVIIKATKSAKISPENSFRERKYTQTESESVPKSTMDKEQKKGEELIAADSGCVLNDDQEVPGATIARTPPISSPPLSDCSLHSGDSGQGSSPPQSVGAPTTTYDFVIVNSFVGVLIGRKGYFLSAIKAQTGANVVVRRHNFRRTKICRIEGTQSEIDAALKLIRERLPEDRYPDLSMERIFCSDNNTIVPTFNASTLHLQLIEGINNDVSISTTITGGHMFLQQPLHPSFPALNFLQQQMNNSYSKTTAPALPVIIDNAICTVCVQENWYRVQIISHNPHTKTCLAKYLDFGGYVSVHADALRQIHADFMSVPFQAIECVLSNVRAPNGGDWSKEAVDTIHSFTHGVVVQAQVAGYTSDDLPEVLLFVSITKDNVLFINQELVARGLAEWVEA